MDISSTRSLNGLLAQLGASGGTPPVPGTNRVGASTQPEPSPAKPPAGGLADAVAQALSRIELGTDSTRPVTAVSDTGDAAATGSTSSSDPLQALGAFLQELMASLRDQGAQIPGTQGDGGGNATSAVSSRAYRPPNLQSDLQSLIRTVNGSGNGTGAQDSGPGALQQRFDNLLASLGGRSNGSATLAGFLQSMADNLPAAPSARGNVVSTSA